jgi:hypothetical protein
LAEFYNIDPQFIDRSGTSTAIWSWLIPIRPFLRLKLGLPGWVRRGRRPRPAAGRPNPNFSLKIRPYRNKSGPDMRISTNAAGYLLGGNKFRRTTNSGRRLTAFDQYGVDVVKNRSMGVRSINYSINRRSIKKTFDQWEFD